MVLLFLSTLIFLWIINDLSFNSRDINRMLQFQMSPSPLSAPPLFTLSGILTVSFTLIKTNNKLIHLIRVIQKLNTSAIYCPRHCGWSKTSSILSCHGFLSSLLEQGCALNGHPQPDTMVGRKCCASKHPLGPACSAALP